MRTPLERKILDVISQSQMIEPGARVAVAVSGGADSVALFRLLLKLRDSLGVSILIVHFDHALRGAESDLDAQFVAALAKQHQIEFIKERADVSCVAKKLHLNLEDAARRLRYEYFHRVIDQGLATRVAVAHTAEDQAETVLARLFRGTGPEGLAGIYPAIGPIVRPLLDTRRKDLRQYLAHLGQAWREDSTNSDLRRQRARIRAQLLPVLENDFSLGIVKNLGNLARFSREEQDFWRFLLTDLFNKHVSTQMTEHSNVCSIGITDLLAPLRLSLPTRSDFIEHPNGSKFQAPLTEKLVRRLYESMRGDCRDLTAIHVQQVIRLASRSTSGRQIELPGGIGVERCFNRLIFSRKPCRPGNGKSTAPQQPSSAYHYAVRFPSSGVAAISVPELGRRFLLKVIDWPCPERDTTQADALDADLLRNPLTLRNWRPGDAYRPRGRRQVRKLKELFLVHRVPGRERCTWPVIECGGRIVWARGMPPAADFCVGGQTRMALVIEEASL